MESISTWVRAINSVLETSNNTNMPITTDRLIANRIPTELVNADFRINQVSPSAVSSPKARLGPSTGAITIASMTTATLFSIQVQPRIFFGTYVEGFTCGGGFSLLLARLFRWFGQ